MEMVGFFSHTSKERGLLSSNQVLNNKKHLLKSNYYGTLSEVINMEGLR